MRRSVALLLTVVGALASSAVAEEPVHFADANLCRLVEAALVYAPNPTPTDMLKLTDLEKEKQRITSLVGLEYAKNLTVLVLHAAYDIKDLSPLAGLTHLELIDLGHSQISDVSPLLGLTNLEQLSVDGNPLSEECYYTYLPQIAVNNPGIFLEYNPSGYPPREVTASDGIYPDRVRITWNPVASGPVPFADTIRYRVHRSYSPDGPKYDISDWITDTTFDDTTAGPGQHYWYWVTSTNAWDNSPDGWKFHSPDEGYTGSGHPCTLSTSSTSGGTVPVPGLGGFQYTPGTAVSIGATPVENYHFVNWTGTAVTAGKVADAGAVNTTVTMDADYTLQANFAIDRQTLATRSSAGGTVSAPGTGSFQFDHGTTVSVTATAASNYHFVNWTGSAVTAGNVANPSAAGTTVTMNADYTLQANFAIDRQTLTTSSTTGGTVSTPGAGGFQYDHGTTVSVTATAGASYHFVNWTGTAVTAGTVANPSAASTTVTMNGDYTLQANFAIDRQTLTTSATTGGSVSAPGSGSFQYDHGTTVAVTATATSNYHFVNWTGSAVTAGNVANPSAASTTVTMNADYTLQANFAIDRQTLTTRSTIGGSVSAPGSGGFQYDHGTTVSVTATAGANYHFVNWTGTAVTAGTVANPSAASTTVTMNADYTLQANFAIDRQTLTTSSTTGGSVSAPGAGSFQYDHGTTVTVTATATSNYHFVNWTGTAVAAGSVANPSAASTAVTMNGDYTLQANFVNGQRTLATSSTPGGAVSIPGLGSFTYEAGTTVPVTATPDATHQFVNWTGTAVTAGKVLDARAASTTVLVDADCTLRANFESIQYTLAISATAGGSVVTPGAGVGTYPYAAGDVAWIVAEPDPLFRFVGWRGGFYSNVNQSSITMTSNCAVKACFESVLDTIAVDGNAAGDLAQDGTAQHPFDGIQKAIDVAKKGAKVVIRPGTYLETIDLQGKSIELNGLNCVDGIIGALPVIDGQGKDTVVRCTQGEDPNCVVCGLVITGGQGRAAGGIVCSGSSPSFVNCLIVGNHLPDPNHAGYIGGEAGDCVNGGALYCKDSSATFVNCTISGNRGVPGSPALGFKDSRVTMANSIVWGNGPIEIVALGVQQPVVTYSDVAGGWTGAGNTDKDPLFAVPGFWVSASDLTQVVVGDDPSAIWVKGDYHLRSQAGRWDAVLGWVKDSETSPCIDAGDPSSSVGQEPQPNGLRVNMGAYGATCQASLSK